MSERGSSVGFPVVADVPVVPGTPEGPEVPVGPGMPEGPGVPEDLVWLVEGPDTSDFGLNVKISIMSAEAISFVVKSRMDCKKAWSCPTSISDFGCLSSTFSAICFSISFWAANNVDHIT